MKHDSLSAALAAFQAELPSIAKDKSADAGKYKYSFADLSDVSDAVLPVLGKHGLAWSTRPTFEDGVFMLRYSLMHEGGQSVDGLYPLPAANTPAQQMGGAITYARRYALCAVTGVAPGGDDTDAAPSAPNAVPEAKEPPEAWADMVGAILTKAEANALWSRAGQEGWLTAAVQKKITERVAEVES